MLTEIAYQRGAKDVLVRWHSDVTGKLRYLHGHDDIFGVKKQWLVEYTNMIVEEDYQLLTLVSSDPQLLEDVDPDKLKKENDTATDIFKPLQEKTRANAVQWTIVNLPSPEWARKVFPCSTDIEEAEEMMWEAIFNVNLIDDNDPLDNWDKHISSLKALAKKMNDYNFQSITFKNSLGTKLEVGLPEGHQWISCGQSTQTGNAFISNLPTYEIYTAPHRNQVTGIVYATKPIIYMGNIIDDFGIRFEEGQVIDYKANVGQEHLQALISRYPNGNFLGEVALVPQSSPISYLGLLWYRTIYDENASSHLALGNGYPPTVKDTESLTEAERMARGLNQCESHVDFMIGSPCLQVIGKTHDGQHVQVFTNGEWAI
ncbi:MAG: aminopeptidase [Defluviitaleaceae bacterium]|nr:aminopeptidase [Defluviitaleaceae bacterium]